jgi:hypothetical protein
LIRDGKIRDFETNGNMGKEVYGTENDEDDYSEHPEDI